MAHNGHPRITKHRQNLRSPPHGTVPHTPGRHTAPCLSCACLTRPRASPAHMCRTRLDGVPHHDSARLPVCHAPRVRASALGCHVHWLCPVSPLPGASSPTPPCPPLPPHLREVTQLLHCMPHAWASPQAYAAQGHGLATISTPPFSPAKSQSAAPSAQASPPPRGFPAAPCPRLRGSSAPDGAARKIGTTTHALLQVCPLGSNTRPLCRPRAGHCQRPT